MIIDSNQEFRPRLNWFNSWLMNLIHLLEKAKWVPYNRYDYEDTRILNHLVDFMINIKLPEVDCYKYSQQTN